MLQNIENRISLNTYMERQTVALWIRGKTKKEIKPKEKNALDMRWRQSLTFILIKTVISYLD